MRPAPQLLFAFVLSSAFVPELGRSALGWAETLWMAFWEGDETTTTLDKGGAKGVAHARKKLSDVEI